MPPVAQVFPAYLAVHLARKHAMDSAVSGQLAGASMFLRVQLVPEQGRALTPLRFRECKELAGDEVARMRGHEIEETGFFFGVAKCLQGSDMVGCDVHRERISAVISR